MGLKLVSKNYYTLIREDSKIITEFDDAYFEQLKLEGWRAVESFNIKQKRVIRRWVITISTKYQVN